MLCSLSASFSCLICLFRTSNSNTSCFKDWTCEAPRVSSIGQIKCLTNVRSQGRIPKSLGVRSVNRPRGVDALRVASTQCLKPWTKLLPTDPGIREPVSEKKKRIGLVHLVSCGAEWYSGLQLSFLKIRGSHTPPVDLDLFRVFFLD